jgi:peptide/nickel transport system substrate-binding protein
MRARNSIFLVALAVAIGGPACPPFRRRPNSWCDTAFRWADIPLTTGQPDRGAAAYQFTAYTIYDPLAGQVDLIETPAPDAGFRT